MKTRILFLTLIFILSLTSCTIKYALKDEVDHKLKSHFGSLYDNPKYSISLITYKFYNNHLEERVLLSENSTLIKEKKGYFKADTVKTDYDWQELMIFFDDSKKLPCKLCKDMETQQLAYKKAGTPVYLISLKGRMVQNEKKYSGIYIFEGIVQCSEPGPELDRVVTNISINKHLRWFPDKKGNIKVDKDSKFDYPEAMTAISKISADMVTVEALIDNEFLVKGEQSVMYDMKEIFGEHLEFVRDVQR